MTGDLAPHKAPEGQVHVDELPEIVELQGDVSKRDSRVGQFVGQN